MQYDLNARNSRVGRRHFLKTASMSLGTLGLAETSLPAATPQPSLAQPSRLRLGTVTYNIAKDWDVPTIIKNCEATKFEGVELRTTHAHGVEVSLTADQRAEVGRRFRDSKVALMGLGSIFDYHTPDQEKLKRDLAATKEYILLARDVGAPGVKVRPNGIPKEVPKEKTLEQIGHSLREIGIFGEEHGIQIRLEVHGGESQLLPNIRRMLDVADHKNVGVCWNTNSTDLDGDGFDHNFDLVKDKIFTVHLHDLFDETYPFRRLFTRLNEAGKTCFCLAEIPESSDPLRVMRYFRTNFLAYQNLL